MPAKKTAAPVLSPAVVAQRNANDAAKRKPLVNKAIADENGIVKPKRVYTRKKVEAPKVIGRISFFNEPKKNNNKLKVIRRNEALAAKEASAAAHRAAALA